MTNTQNIDEDRDSSLRLTPQPEAPTTGQTSGRIIIESLKS